MTNEKAIEVIQKNCYVSNLLDLDETVMINTAMDRAVEALNKTSDKELIKQFKSIVRGDCIMLTREAYSDLCLLAARQNLQPCEDCISRQQALDAFGLSEKTSKYGGDHSGYDTMMLYEIQDILEDLPSVKPSSTGSSTDSSTEWRMKHEENTNTV